VEEYSVEQLLDEYIFQRQNRVKPEAALKLLFEMRSNLSQEERQWLSRQIRAWENQYGADAPPPPAKAKSAPSAPANTVACQNCGTPNPPEAKYCYACGFLLTQRTSSATERLEEEDTVDDSFFGPQTLLLIVARGHEQNPLRVQVSNTPMILGRFDKDTNFRPQVDLSPFGAQDLGVSRHHAMLGRGQTTLTLTDNGSTNFTYINGEKLLPQEVRVIRNGDEVRFGRLVTRFVFQREVRKLS